MFTRWEPLRLYEKLLAEPPTASFRATKDCATLEEQIPYLLFLFKVGYQRFVPGQELDDEAEDIARHMLRHRLPGDLLSRKLDLKPEFAFSSLAHGAITGKFKAGRINNAGVVWGVSALQDFLYERRKQIAAKYWGENETVNDNPVKLSLRRRSAIIPPSIERQAIHALQYEEYEGEYWPRDPEDVSVEEWREVYDSWPQIPYDNDQQRQQDLEFLWLLGQDLLELSQQWDALLVLAEEALAKPNLDKQSPPHIHPIHVKTFALHRLGHADEGTNFFIEQVALLPKPRQEVHYIGGMSILRSHHLATEGDYPNLKFHSDEELARGAGTPLSTAHATIARRFLSLQSRACYIAPLTWEGLQSFYESLWATDYYTDLKI